MTGLIIAVVILGCLVAALGFFGLCATQQILGLQEQLYDREEDAAPMEPIEWDWARGEDEDAR